MSYGFDGGNIQPWSEMLEDGNFGRKSVGVNYNVENDGPLYSAFAGCFVVNGVLLRDNSRHSDAGLAEAYSMIRASPGPEGGMASARFPAGV